MMFIKLLWILIVFVILRFLFFNGLLISIIVKLYLMDMKNNYDKNIFLKYKIYG